MPWLLMAKPTIPTAVLRPIPSGPTCNNEETADSRSSDGTRSFLSFQQKIHGKPQFSHPNIGCSLVSFPFCTNKSIQKYVCVYNIYIYMAELPCEFPFNSGMVSETFRCVVNIFPNYVSGNSVLIIEAYRYPHNGQIIRTCPISCYTWDSPLGKSNHGVLRD